MRQRTALLSVFHKEGIVEFANQLTELGWQIIRLFCTRQAQDRS